jgi:hypothetical protein
MTAQHTTSSSAVKGLTFLSNPTINTNNEYTIMGTDFLFEDQCSIRKTPERFPVSDVNEANFTKRGRPLASCVLAAFMS